jgi:hypothetical protein
MHSCAVAVPERLPDCVIAFAFTRRGALSPFTGRPWPLPEAGHPSAWFTEPHACRADALPVWIAPELWRIEVEDVLGEEHGRIFARRGRLLERLAAWDAAAAEAFAIDCCEHARGLVSRWDGDPEVRAALLADAPLVANGPSANVAGYFAALAAERVGGPEAAAAERRRQAGWLIARLPPIDSVPR